MAIVRVSRFWSLGSTDFYFVCWQILTFSSDSVPQ